ncbi:hypothetical protein LOK49_LG01G02355 [Camellia lanceoleosa]|uniref:Uncharacterized protein n=1 Tax=Camellia lanceoleosa TaxID=1840588 RepID=A0ACC0J0X9_9ERIC|nr:hypothetical protein LOK49_LG01G02355 [Camellia lanceoleosa]
MGQRLWLLYQSSDLADNDAWKDKGTGQLSIKCKEGVDKGTREFRPTILVRNDYLNTADFARREELSPKAAILAEKFARLIMVRGCDSLVD